jgi:hypothetical protein
VGTGFRTRSRTNEKCVIPKSGHRFSDKITRKQKRFRLLHRHPEARAPQASLRSLRKLGCVRASKGDGPDPSWGRSSFGARPLAGHLRMTDNDRCIGRCDGIRLVPRRRTRIGRLRRHPEARAPQASLRSLRKLGCVRASKGDGPDPAAGWRPLILRGPAVGRAPQDDGQRAIALPSTGVHVYGIPPVLRDVTLTKV